MPTIIPHLIAGVSTTAFFALWFWVVRRELLFKHQVVQSAADQLNACRKLYLQSKDSDGEMEAESVLIRSQDIYNQSVTLYNQTPKKPLFYIPGLIMGFRVLEKRI